jgi:phage-related protein
MTKQVRKPAKWVSSAKRDLDAMPEDVKDVFAHAINLAQAGTRHDFDTWLAQQGVRK